MEWEWILPSPADLLLRSILRHLSERRLLALERQARSWPRASGHVHSTQVKRAERPKDGWYCWQAELSYSYTVNGEYYSGTRLLPPESEDEAYELAKCWKDRDVTVRYCQEEVTDSVFLLEDQGEPVSQSRR